jgi:toxin FitB
MIILDTNVVSEPMKPSANLAVQKWLDEQVVETLFLTATSLSELLVGIEFMPEGKRKNNFKLALTHLLNQFFSGRILSFDQQAAMVLPDLLAKARTEGKSISVADGQIAAIAKTHNFTVATRDTTPFLALGIPVINPWEL